MKTIHANFSTIFLEEILKWATLNGAKALKMENALGSFETGKKPGAVLIKGIEKGKITSECLVKRII